MKKVYLFVLLLVIFNMSSAQKDFDVVVSLGTDLKMATEGPYKGKPNDMGTTLDYELRAFIDYERSRFGATFQSHQAIHFYKWAIVYDYKFKDLPLKNIIIAVGPEMGMIKRTHRLGYRKTTHDWVQLGANFDLSYVFKNSNLALGFTYNVYRAEEELRNYGKHFRQDVNFYVSMRLGS